MIKGEDRDEEALSDLVPNPWHKLHPMAYTLAEAEASGALAGHMAGVGEPFLWTSALVAAVRRAAAVAFDHGFELARREEHECAAHAGCEALLNRAADAQCGCLGGLLAEYGV